VWSFRSDVDDAEVYDSDLFVACDYETLISDFLQ
jgi:hypothetical protein